MTPPTEKMLCEAFRKIVPLLEDECIEVTAGGIAPAQAIGAPPRDDFALIRGKEKIVEANFKGCRGHAFSAADVSFSGRLGDILALPLESVSERAVYYAALNAVLASQGLVERTVHCRDKEPMQCGERLAEFLTDADSLPGSVCLVGYQPGMVKALAPFCRARGVAFAVTDMNPVNIGTEMSGVEIQDGEGNEQVIGESELVFCTGSTIVNGSIWDILDACCAQGTEVVFFGVTVQGPAALMGWKTFCPYGRKGSDH